MNSYRDSEVKRCRFQPWMGYLVAAVLVASAWNRDTPVWIIVRATGATCFFTSVYIGERRRNERSSGSSVAQLRSFVFAIFCGLLTLLFLLAYILGVWAKWIGRF